MASHQPLRATLELRDVEALTASFLERFEGEKHTRAVELLDLARTSYRLRDNDNIHLARIEAQKLAAVEEGKRRIALRGRADVYHPLVEEVSRQSQTVGLKPRHRPRFSPLELISPCDPGSSLVSLQGLVFREGLQESSWSRPIWESFGTGKSWCVMR